MLLACIRPTIYSIFKMPRTCADIHPVFMWLMLYIKTSNKKTATTFSQRWRLWSMIFHTSRPDSSKCSGYTQPENSTIRYCPHRLRTRGFGWFLSPLRGNHPTENTRKRVERKQEPSKTYTLTLEDLSIRGLFYLNIPGIYQQPKNWHLRFSPKKKNKQLLNCLLCEDSGLQPGASTRPQQSSYRCLPAATPLKNHRSRDGFTTKKTCWPREKALIQVEDL